MEVTEVRMKLAPGRPDGAAADPRDRFLAVASLTFDRCFVVHDVRVIRGPNGLIVAMPSRRLADRCRCGAKTPLTHRYCHDCGTALADSRARDQNGGRPQLHEDLVHPIVASCREAIQQAVFATYQTLLEQARPARMTAEPARAQEAAA
jgi:stage V sporulation protein G